MIESFEINRLKKKCHFHSEHIFSYPFSETPDSFFKLLPVSLEIARKKYSGLMYTLTDDCRDGARRIIVNEGRDGWEYLVEVLLELEEMPYPLLCRTYRRARAVYEMQKRNDFAAVDPYDATVAVTAPVMAYVRGLYILNDIK